MSLETTLKILNCDCKCHPINHYKENSCNDLGFLAELTQKFHIKTTECNCNCDKEIENKQEGLDYEQD